jgi:hypothetical protein
MPVLISGRYKEVGANLVNPRFALTPNYFVHIHAEISSSYWQSWANCLWPRLLHTVRTLVCYRSGIAENTRAVECKVECIAYEYHDIHYHTARLTARRASAVAVLDIVLAHSISIPVSFCLLLRQNDWHTDRQIQRDESWITRIF